MDISVAEDQPAWGHALQAQDALLDFTAYMEECNINYRDTETPEQAAQWPFSEFPQVSAVQEMYKPEPKQMPSICFRCSLTGQFYFFAT